MEEKINEYVLKGGYLFNVEKIDSYRDGGTKIIRCRNYDTFYIDKVTKNFHLGYPTTNENLITDDLLITYLLDRIKVYVKRLHDEVKWNEFIYKELSEKYIAG